MSHLALAAIGRDRPGIVATLSRVLYEHGVNVEDSQMTILRGHFTVMLVLAAPAGLDEGRLRSDLDSARGELELEALSLSAIAEPTGDEGPADPSHVVTVYGIDHPGILHAVSAALAGAGVNITDLNTRLIEEEPDDAEQPGESIYVMLMEVALPGELAPEELEGLLERTGRDEGVEVSVRPLEPDVL
jgi:glycine cleavage system transcriptional repressor